MARVNIGLAQWDQFLRAADSADRSVADHLGHLVRKELRRVDRREGQTALARSPNECPQLVAPGADGVDPVSRTP